ncbi:MAG: hypothetical protein LBS71_00795 [Puniceicoccales bacterium]|jgi:hypothetical protein|nr:hypothetical protein [Puniceicoccales bacterium]
MNRAEARVFLGIKNNEKTRLSITERERIWIGSVCKIHAPDGKLPPSEMEKKSNYMMNKIQRAVKIIEQSKSYQSIPRPTPPIRQSSNPPVQRNSNPPIRQSSNPKAHTASAPSVKSTPKKENNPFSKNYSLTDKNIHLTENKGFQLPGEVNDSSSDSDSNIKININKDINKNKDIHLTECNAFKLPGRANNSSSDSD